VRKSETNGSETWLAAAWPFMECLYAAFWYERDNKQPMYLDINLSQFYYIHHTSHTNFLYTEPWPPE
jgi:hypothetical protein